MLETIQFRHERIMVPSDFTELVLPSAALTELLYFCPFRPLIVLACFARTDTFYPADLEPQIIVVAQRLARVCIEDAINYAARRKVFGKRLIDSEVIRNKVSFALLVLLYRPHSMLTVGRPPSSPTWPASSRLSRLGSR